jgi:hypothetical protein
VGRRNCCCNVAAAAKQKRQATKHLPKAIRLGNLQPVMSAGQSCLSAHAELPFGASTIPCRSAPSSSRKTRAMGVRQHPSGRKLRRRQFRSINTPGLRGCRYKTAPGRSNWPNRDPLEENGGNNLYGFVHNDPFSNIDIDGREIGSICPKCGHYYVGRGMHVCGPALPCPVLQDLPPGFRFYRFGSRGDGYGDWVPGSSLTICKLLADERRLKRQQKWLASKMKLQCLPGWLPGKLGVGAETLHFASLFKTMSRAEESDLVWKLDNWACYMWWQETELPPCFELPNIRLPWQVSP